MNKRPIDKTKKSNIKCEHCCNYAIVYDSNYQMVGSKCRLFPDKPINYWNRCKNFEWAESEDKE